ncbi:hypothetical protein R50072_35390 [Simiduia litorea]|uniref:alpha/beta fold hydrolase n=1 Tax=Simiduia litorea TaxID=1435348 RepID=UPI0036F3C7D0
MKIILLPGLDGTGLLFNDLVAQLPKEWDVKILSYDSIQDTSYSGQAEEISEHLKGMDIFLVGESYSGRVAYELHQILGDRVKGIVFLASFISSPSLVSRLAKLLPVSLLSSNILSRFILYLFGFNFSGGSSLVAPVFESIKKADKVKLRSRLRNIATLNIPKHDIKCPVTYIRPTSDLLVGVKAFNVLASRAAHLNVVKVRGGHFIAQSNPVACGEIICNAVSM